MDKKEVKKLVKKQVKKQVKKLGKKLLKKLEMNLKIKELIYLKEFITEGTPNDAQEGYYPETDQKFSFEEINGSNFRLKVAGEWPEGWHGSKFELITDSGSDAGIDYEAMEEFIDKPRLYGINKIKNDTDYHIWFVLDGNGQIECIARAVLFENNTGGYTTHFN